MMLLTPLGLLGLIGIIALIIIYILKPKYQEKQLSSTFIWKLSLKYKKQRVPLEWLKSSLIFFLQVLMITLITLLLSDPQVVLPTESGEKIVILDTSASMLATSGEETRFDRAIKEIEALAALTVPKDRVTIIVAGHEANFVVRRSDSLEYIKQNLSQTEATFGISDMDLAMELAEIILYENPAAKVYYFTSQTYNHPGEVVVKDMSKGEWNAAVLNVEAKIQQNGYYQFEAKIASFGQAASIAVGLKVNGAFKQAIVTQVAANEVVTVAFENAPTLTYSFAEVYIDSADSFTYDNQFSLYGGNVEQFKVQLTTDAPDNLSSTLFFVRNALSAVNSNYYLTTTATTDDAKSVGFDLYIYDGYVPETLPVDGAVWIFNPKSLPSALGMVLGSTIEGSFTFATQNSSSEVYHQIMRQIEPESLTVSKYARIAAYPGFEKMMTANNDPMLLTRNIDGVKVTIFPFDLSYSNLAVSTNFPLLIRNLANYSLVPTFDSHLYQVDQVVTLQAKPSAVLMKLSSGDLEEVYATDVATHQVILPGVYTVTQTFADSSTKQESFFVRIAEAESRFNLNGDTIIMPFIPGTPSNTPVNYDLMALLPYLAALLLVVALIEWGVQYREQY